MALAGKRLDGGIRLVRPVGSGSHAVAYLAVTPGGQPCAVKLFRPAMLQHAWSEWQVGRQFRHPRLARVVRLTQLDEYPALIMSWVPGETLFAHYRRRPALRLEPYAYLTTLADVLEGLDHMHGLGMLHRDIKPDNILVQPSGRATLVDYDLSGPSEETLAGQIGTPAFQSPEAQRGADLGTGSDLYGVGLLLHWGLWGALPDPSGLPPELEGDVQAAAQAEVPFLSAALALTGDLLHPAPGQRPTSAQAVRRDLLTWRSQLRVPSGLPPESPLISGVPGSGVPGPLSPAGDQDAPG